MAILEQGGNAFDAAVTVSAVLAVVEPYSSGMGGGGFWLLHQASTGRETVIDGRETAPAAAHADLYVGEDGQLIPKLSIDGPLAAGIPGQPAALVYIAKRYGRLPLTQTLAPAIELARRGFEIDEHYLEMARWRLPVLQRYSSTSEQFLVKGELPTVGATIRQSDLADTLELIANQGNAGFYSGPFAAKMVNAVRDAGGIWSLADLEGYKVIERVPVSMSYRGARLASAPPPSSGGVALATMLHGLENFSLDQLDEVGRIHLIIELMRRAYRDRAQFLGDPDYVDVPVEMLTHPWYAAGLVRDLSLDQAGESTPAGRLQQEGTDTTHFSIIDIEGNLVSATLSINYPFGSGFVIPGTGLLLNDEMDDFSSQPGKPNVYGLVGGKANAIEPGKRMLSSMSPTILQTANGLAVLGTPGGSRIITMVLLGILSAMDGDSPEDWVAQPRFHHQYLPDSIQFEPGALSEEMQNKLTELGHQLTPLKHSYGDMQALYWDMNSGELSGASDPRGNGLTEIK